jgi:peptide deformylase
LSNKRKLKSRFYNDGIVKYPDESLFAVSENIVNFDSVDIANVMVKLSKTQRKSGVVAVAAPQIGVFKKIFYYILPNVGEGFMINPEIVDFSKHNETMEEGCLSIPGWYWQVSRPASVKVRWFDHHGSEFEGVLDGLMGRVVQHEIDHFNGILLPDYFDDETFERFSEDFFENGKIGEDWSSNIIKVN